MKFEFQYSSGNPCCSTLDIYDRENRPFCKIEENDLFEMISEKQYDKLCYEGGNEVNVSKTELLKKAIKIY